MAFLVLAFFSGMVSAEQSSYQVNPGDALQIFVWNEEGLTREVLVRPDGFISVPLVGQVKAGGLTPEAIETRLVEGYSKYLKDAPTVTVSLLQIGGYKVYVVGKVNRPGEYPINRPTDVMQALAMAGGLNTFAKENDINILRRKADGSQEAIKFAYGKVKDGDQLQTNIILKSGDVVVVP
ncbi:MAG TPA: polysaccharide biosynthesis/export family protein [Spongiibacteraceae bacterium]|nr:polysaccharide biosynthesis/export family protein [Spongiibacteraceae bacterium]HUH38801.1 polysaccharide biosynthesis/export family protein [Spongiibacteraceae bacterium]